MMPPSLTATLRIQGDPHENRTDRFRARDGNTLEDNMWNRAFLDRLGIQITYDWIARSDEGFSQKWGVTVASGDIPDMMELQLIDLKRLYDAGALAPLQDAYDQYIWPKLKEENLDFASDEAWSSVRFDEFVRRLAQARRHGHHGRRQRVVQLRVELSQVGPAAPRTRKPQSRTG